jgi:MoxR-like ATPase
LNAQSVANFGEGVLGEVERAIVGKRTLLLDMMAGILAGGHILLEDFPGLAKTLIAKSFAAALGLEFKRIQFTPDLLPGDITGGYVLDRKSGEFILRKGPIFANIILADEINRASPKTQAALLEAMQEFQVTIEGETLLLPNPFIVIATQNPIEYEGTFPLPEAQLDRFLMQLKVGYPSLEEEQRILTNRLDRGQDNFNLTQLENSTNLDMVRQQVEEVSVHDDVKQYIVNLVAATREDHRIALGASPRGSLALMMLSRAKAALEGRGYVLPDDPKHFYLPALTHRLILEPELWLRRDAGTEILKSILTTVEVPVLEGI